MSTMNPEKNIVEINLKTMMTVIMITTQTMMMMKMMAVTI